ncbi:MAG: LytTR family DNA-binding domain-containing protein [Bacteroidota bacterium]
MPVSPLKVFIIDDEYQSRNLLGKLLLEHFPEIIVAGQASNVADGIAGIKEFSPGLIFLDIEMNGETGFDLLRKIETRNFKIIFVTAHDAYALKAFRFNAVDYLLKPIVLEELKDAVGKVINQLPEKKSISDAQLENLAQFIQNPKKVNDKIAVPTSDGFVLISVPEIVFCKANGNYTEFHLSDKKQLLSSYTLKQYHELLVEQNFFRAHRSFLINLSHVKMYRRGEGGTIIMNDGSEIELSRQNKEAFFQLFK